MSETKPVTDQSFASDVLEASKSSGPVLVDFWAPWCGPCKAISPALEEIAKDLHGKVTVVKMNVDDNPVTPNSYFVRGIPTLMIFKDGQMAAQKIGGDAKSALKAWVEANV